MRDAVAFLQNRAEDERNAGNGELSRDFAGCADEIKSLRDDVANRIIVIKGYSDELERLRASQERLKSAIEFAHSEGFQWPADPMEEFAAR